MLGRALFTAGNGTLAQSALLLARRLTPWAPGSLSTTRNSGGRRLRVVLLMAVSGPYNRYVAPLIRSARRHLLRGAADVRFVVFSDAAATLAQRYPAGQLPRGTWVARPAGLGWPLAAMLRSRHYADAWHLVRRCCGPVLHAPHTQLSKQMRTQEQKCRSRQDVGGVSEHRVHTTIIVKITQREMKIQKRRSGTRTTPSVSTSIAFSLHPSAPRQGQP